jgi:hypothetical protein
MSSVSERCVCVCVCVIWQMKGWLDLYTLCTVYDCQDLAANFQKW